jgi:hypothetical protein
MQTLLSGHRTVRTHQSHDALREMHEDNRRWRAGRLADALCNDRKSRCVKRAGRAAPAAGPLTCEERISRLEKCALDVPSNLSCELPRDPEFRRDPAVRAVTGQVRLATGT